MELSTRSISLEDLKKLLGPKSFCTKDILLVRISSSRVRLSVSNALLDCMLFLYCKRGSMRLLVNDKEYLVGADEYAVLMPGTVINKSDIDDNKLHDMYVMGFSLGLIKSVIRKDKTAWSLFQTLHTNPLVMHNGRNNMSMDYYGRIARNILSQPMTVYQEDTLKYLFSALLCEILAHLHRSLAVDAVSNEIKDLYSHELVERFVKEVIADDGMHRSVAYFAGILCCTPSYLYKYVHHITGMKPIDIINRCAVESIKEALKDRSMSIKEVSEKFNFANPSFFGVYVKKHLGASPCKVRDTL